MHALFPNSALSTLHTNARASKPAPWTLQHPPAPPPPSKPPRRTPSKTSRMALGGLGGAGGGWVRGWFHAAVWKTGSCDRAQRRRWSLTTISARGSGLHKARPPRPFCPSPALFLFLSSPPDLSATLTPFIRDPCPSSKAPSVSRATERQPRRSMRKQTVVKHAAACSCLLMSVR